MSGTRGHSSSTRLVFLLAFCILQCQSFTWVSPALFRKTPIGPLVAQRREAETLTHERNTSYHRFFQTEIALQSRGGGQNDVVSTPKSSLLSNIGKAADKHFFLLGLSLAVSSARLFPKLGTDGGILQPELFLGKYGVGLIFLLSGLSLQTSELTKAVSNIPLNLLIQLSTFLLWPVAIGLPLRYTLTEWFPTFLPAPLVDGLFIMTCLPTTINMCIMLTSASGGNVAASICNAVLSNMVGIFLTPAWLLRFFGTEIRLPFVQMIIKLCRKVLLPVAVGQLLRLTKVKGLYTSNAKFFKRLQEVILLGIAWNAFSNAFYKGMGLTLSQSAFLLVLLPTLHLGSMWFFFQFFSLMKFSPKEVVAAAFCASQKTLAFGLPLVNTIFQGSPNLASYAAPLMFIHPLQMTLGSLLIPVINRYATSQDQPDKAPNK
eukprot:Nitzschia sp. Nitz4//scaffold21_size171442//3970//5507//NITZ4_002137-RA/size171442-augustus-gene-0.197-mRNA-1//-1//CDS//3329542339//6976//frame0